MTDARAKEERKIREAEIGEGEGGESARRKNGRNGQKRQLRVRERSGTVTGRG